MFFVGLLALIALLVGGRVGWLYLRRAVSRACQRRLDRPSGPRVRAWMERQAAWSFDEAWKKMWTSE